MWLVGRFNWDLIVEKFKMIIIIEQVDGKKLLLFTTIFLIAIEMNTIWANNP